MTPRLHVFGFCGSGTHERRMDPSSTWCEFRIWVDPAYGFRCRTAFDLTGVSLPMKTSNNSGLRKALEDHPQKGPIVTRSAMVMNGRGSRTPMLTPQKDSKER